jgi:hypothetical protein
MYMYIYVCNVYIYIYIYIHIHIHTYAYTESTEGRKMKEGRKENGRRTEGDDYFVLEYPY